MQAAPATLIVIREDVWAQRRPAMVWDAAGLVRLAISVCARRIRFIPRSAIARIECEHAVWSLCDALKCQFLLGRFNGDEPCYFSLLPTTHQLLRGEERGVCVSLVHCRS